MELGSVVEYLEHKTILVTGAAGFLAKIFIEKIMREHPNVKKLYLLLRASDNKSALQRFDTEVMTKELFKVVKEKWGSNLNGLIQQKIKVVAGDITCKNLGIKDTSILEEMRAEVEIVVNLAATTNFYERYDVSFNINTMGAKNVLDFAKSCAKIKLLLHVSTAYVSGKKEGLIKETPYKMGETLNDSKGLEIDGEEKLMLETLEALRAECSSDEAVRSAMKDLGIQRAKKYGWPNTYVFTKAMGEMVLGHYKGNTPLVIIRPTIITSTYKQPFPGWVEGIRTIDSVAIGYAKGKIKSCLGDPQTIVDLIPADMVVNAMIMAIASENCDGIYHIGSSSSNPIDFYHIQDYTMRYFIKNPCINKYGKPIIVERIKFIPTMDSFKRFMNIHYLLPLKGLQVLNSAMCHSLNGIYQDRRKKITFIMKMMEVYGPYFCFKGIYDDKNMKLLMTAKEEDQLIFDPQDIDWEDYLMNTHLPGVVKYLCK